MGENSPLVGVIPGTKKDGCCLGINSTIYINELDEGNESNVSNDDDDKMKSRKASYEEDRESEKE